MIMTLDVLRDLTDDIIKELCRAIRKPGGDGSGHQISKLSMTRVKLFAFWARHMWQTSRGVNDWTNMTYDKVKTLTNQRTLKDNLLDSKPPETPAPQPAFGSQGFHQHAYYSWQDAGNSWTSPQLRPASQLDKALQHGYG